MRILFVTPLFLPSLSGAAVYFDTLTREIARQEPDARLTILTRRVSGAPAVERCGAVTVLRRLPRARGGTDGTPAGRAAAVVTGAMILGAAYRDRSDVVHYHTQASYRVLHALAPCFRARLVADMRDLAAEHEGADVRYYARCHRVICAAENVCQYLRRAGFPPEKLAHVPVPLAPLPAPSPASVRAVRARLGLPDEAPYVLHLGHLTPAKGVPELLDAMERLWAARPDLHLVLAGARAAGADASFDHRLAAVLAREPRVHWTGPVGREDVPALLGGAAVFVLASRSEGLPRACLEALSLGVNVVLPPGVPEFARACPDAVLGRVEPGAIAAAVDAALRRARPPAYPLAAHDVGAVAARTLAVYREALGDHGAPSGAPTPA